MDPSRENLFFKIKRVLIIKYSHDLLKNLFLISGFNGIAALFTLFLQVFLARLLGPDEYGIFGSSVYITYIFLVMLSIVTIVIAHFVGFFRTRYQNEKINTILKIGLSWFFLVGLIIFLSFLFFSKSLAIFFKYTSSMQVIWLGAALFFMVLYPVFDGIFIGLQNYKSLGMFKITDAIIKLVLGVALVVIGFGSTGAIFALFFGSAAAVFVAYSLTSNIRKLNMSYVDFRAIITYAKYAFLVLFCISLLANLDIVLVKHFFDSYTAGLYVAASVIAKFPFFISVMFGMVMFSKVTELHANGKNTSKILQSLLLYLTILILVLVVLCVLIPNFLLSLFFGSVYSINSILGLYVFSMGVLGIVNVLLLYNLAVKRFDLLYIPFIFLLAQIFFFGLIPASITKVIIFSVIVSSLLLAVTLIFSKDLIDFDIFFSRMKKIRPPKYVMLRR